MVFGVFPVLKRNFRIMLNSKLTFLILIFGPLFLMAVTGAALQNTSLKNIETGVYAHAEHSLYESLGNDLFVSGFIDKLYENSFIVHEENSLEKCKQDVLNSRTHVCIEIIKKEPIEVFGRDIIENVNYDIRAHVDFSKSRIVWGVIASIQSVVDDYTSELARAALLDFQEQISKPRGVLEEKYWDVKSLIDNFEELESRFDSMENEFNSLQIEMETLNTNFNTLEARINEAIPYVEAVNSSLAAQITESLSLIRGNINNLQGKIYSGQILDEIDASRREVRKAKKDLIGLRGDLSNVLDEWNEIKAINFENLAPLAFTYQSVSEKKPGPTGDRLGFLDYLFPSFLMFFIIFVSLVFSTVLIMRERASSSHVRNMTSKTGGLAFTVGNFLSVSFVLILQVAIMLLVSVFFLRLNILSNLFPIVLFSLIAIFLFTIIGIAVGYIFNSQEGAVIAAVSVSLLFLVFLPAITPSETLPVFISSIVSFVPFVVLESKLRLITIFRIFSGFSLGETISIFSSFVISIFLIMIFYKISKRKEI